MEEKQQKEITGVEMAQQVGNIIFAVKERQQRILQKMEPGSRLRRSPFENLDEQGLLTPKNIIVEFNNIMEKKSVLPRSQRDCIVNIVKQAIRDIMRNRAQTQGESNRIDGNKTIKTQPNNVKSKQDKKD